jgi:hypothetical protein
MSHPQGQQLLPVETLYADAVNVQPITRDWSTGYPDGWDWIRVPTCNVCGAVSHENETEIATEAGKLITVGRDCCPDPTCEQFGEELSECEDDGPMMSYSYELPAKCWRPREPWTQADARTIAHLPLLIVYFSGDPSDAALALSGGGMDLAWEISEAFMRLGFLPPAHFAALPKMAGMPATDVHRWVIAGCKQSLGCQRDWADSALARLAEF